jgi:hypothetical protein
VLGHSSCWGTVQVGNTWGTVRSDDVRVDVEGVDIFSLIESHVELHRMTFKTLFMQFNRDKVRRSLWSHLTFFL